MYVFHLQLHPGVSATTFSRSQESPEALNGKDIRGSHTLIRSSPRLVWESSIRGGIGFGSGSESRQAPASIHSVPEPWVRCRSGAVFACLHCAHLQ